MKTFTAIRIVFLSACIGTSATLLAAAKQATYASPSAIAVDMAGKNLYVVEETADTVVKLDAATGKVVKSYTIPGTPGGIAISPDGSQAYVTVAEPEGYIYPINLSTGKSGKKFAVGHTPVAPVVSPDGSLLYVCNRFDNTVAVIDIKTKKEVALIPVLREPIAQCITPDGAYLFVANHLPAVAADGEYVASVISVIDTKKNKVVAQIRLPNGSMAVRGIAMSPDGAHVYVTHVLARYQVPTTQLERGWMNTSGLSVIDAKSLKRINTVLLDDVDLGAANPWGVTVTPDGTNIVVTHAGTHEISVIDRTALHAKLDRVAKGEKVTSVSETADDVPNDLSFLVGIRKRIPLRGNGPRSVAVCNGLIFVGEYFTDSLSVLPCNKIAKNAVKSIALGPRKKADQVRRGERLFNDAAMCFQHWQSCASCHPDGRADGLNWDLLNDGLGNPKQTKNMLMTHVTPPVMVSGIRPKAETAVRAGIKYIQFAVRPEADAKAVDAYLKSLTPVPSPYLENGKLSEAAKRGKELYDTAKCSRCHPGPLYTDLKLHDIGLGIGNEKGTKFDTPTLVEVWRTAPYLYDGRAMTINDVLTTYNTNDTHGATSTLSKDELNDLSEYILSL